MLTLEQARRRLAAHGQGHVLRWFEELPARGQERLLGQVSALDLGWLEGVVGRGGEARARCPQREALDPAQIAPPRGSILPGDPGEERVSRAGLEALAAGRVGVLVVAGGSGSRLGFAGPKGAFPVGPVSRKSLFELHIQRLLAAGRAGDVIPPLYLMTSATNHAETEAFLRRNQLFGLPEERLFIFQQGMAPAVDDRGLLLMADRDRLALFPNGNGGLFAALQQSGALDHMAAAGVDTLSYIHVDNPLSPSCDPLFLGHHLRRRSEFSCKAIPKTRPDERVGSFAEVAGRLRVLEYYEVPEQLIQARDARGRLLYGLSNPGQFLWSRAFVAAQAARRDLPFHLAHKKIPHLDAEGRRVQPTRNNGYKLEAFAMDTLAAARRTLLLQVDRDAEFAPVKNADGRDSPDSARRLMSRLYRAWIEGAGGVLEDPDAPVEISPLYAQDARELAARLPRGFRHAGALYLEKTC